MRIVVCTLAASLCLVSAAHADMSGGKVKIGVLTDLSGPYEQNSGSGSVEAAKMAAEEFGNKINGVPVEIVAADHQNKPDIGAAIARRWLISTASTPSPIWSIRPSALPFWKSPRPTTRRCC